MASPIGPRNRPLSASALTPVRVAALLFGLAFVGCQEAELPVDPEAEARAILDR